MIAHIDADAFFASVLVRSHPSLQGKPVFAIGMGGSCIIAATYEAKAKGVKTGMRLTDARKLVPGAIEMASDFKETAIASEQIESILRDCCPVIEQMSIDEWFVDLHTLVGGDPEDLKLWGKTLQKTILERTALSVSVGIAPTKLLAKMASEYKKPSGVSVVEKRNTEYFLRDRSAAAIPGVGRQRKIQTDLRHLETAWDIASADDDTLIKIFGKPGVMMKQELLGNQMYTVTKDARPPKSISRCRSFPSTRDLALLKAHALKHLEYCTMKMRRENFACQDISLWTRTGGKEYRYTHAHRRCAVPVCTALQLIPTIISMLEKVTTSQGTYTQVGLALSGLKPAGIVQQSLFEDPEKSVAGERLQEALDTLHDRFGRNSITRGAALRVKSGTEPGFDLSIV